MLEAIDLEATRGDAVLFRGLGFAVGPGVLLRVLGANGRGKTTLLRALCGLVMPTAGIVQWKGQNIRALREEYWKFVAYVGHSNALKEDLSAEENLAVTAALSGIRVTPGEARSALERFGLSGRERLPVRSLSQGQRRRAALARLAVSAARPLWILDEPFAALDVAAVETVQALVAGHLAQGGLVALTTHQEARIPAPSVTDLNLD